jgi:pimeloyl-ACP methyl ester carboxylesterase
MPDKCVQRPTGEAIDTGTNYGHTVSIMDDGNSQQSLYETVDDVEVHYQRSGDGQPLLLLHGSTSSLEHFDRATDILDKHFDVIRPDLPGFGLTGARNDRDYRIRTYARTVAGFMAQLGIDRYAIAGNSLGGNIGWNLALDYPERVQALVLVNATGYPEKTLPLGMRLARNPAVAQLMRRFMPRRMVEGGLRQAVGPQSTIVDDAMVDRVHRLWNHNGNRGAFVDFVNTDQPDRTAELGRIQAPTLVLRSANIDGQHFARDIPHAREAINSRTGHLLPEEGPAWFAEEVIGFLSPLQRT